MPKQTRITVVHLYHHNMNIYGDTGNVRCLEWRLRKRQFDVDIVKVEVGQKLPVNTDVIIAGGGQDSGQLVVAGDLQSKAPQLRAMASDGVVMLAVCGMYQLFGHQFITNKQDNIAGIGLFNATTQAGAERLIGNVTVMSLWGQLVGFENHSGQTILAGTQEPLGKVIKGAGNNATSGQEGAISNNCFGTYLHGPLLPKNPVFADHLISLALDRRGLPSSLEPLDDRFALRAAAIAATRPR